MRFRMGMWAEEVGGNFAGKLITSQEAGVSQ